jgi:hypothetical protein
MSRFFTVQSRKVAPWVSLFAACFALLFGSSGICANHEAAAQGVQLMKPIPPRSEDYPVQGESPNVPAVEVQDYVLWYLGADAVVAAAAAEGTDFAAQVYAYAWPRNAMECLLAEDYRLDDLCRAYLYGIDFLPNRNTSMEEKHQIAFQLLSCLFHPHQFWCVAFQAGVSDKLEATLVSAGFVPLTEDVTVSGEAYEVTLRPVQGYCVVDLDWRRFPEGLGEHVDTIVYQGLVPIPDGKISGLLVDPAGLVIPLSCSGGKLYMAEPEEVLLNNKCPALSDEEIII